MRWEEDGGCLGSRWSLEERGVEWGEKSGWKE